MSASGWRSACQVAAQRFAHDVRGPGRATLYLDSRALFKRYIDEPHNDRFHDILDR